MRVKLVTLSYAPSLGGFDDRPLSDFVRDKEVLAGREHASRACVLVARIRHRTTRSAVPAACWGRRKAISCARMAVSGENEPRLAGIPWSEPARLRMAATPVVACGTSAGRMESGGARTPRYGCIE